MTNPSLHHGIILQQRCLHHITSLRFRCLKLHHVRKLPGVIPEDSYMYFTLHSKHRPSKNEDKLFQSQKLPFSSNPTWSHLEISTSRSIKITNFSVHLWIGSKDDYKVALTWEVSLPKLTCIGNVLSNQKLSFAPNSVAFGLHGMYYCSCSSFSFNSADSASHSSRSTASESKLTSYSVAALQRYLRSEQTATTYKFKVVRARRKIKKVQEKHQESMQLEKDLENIRSRIEHVEELLAREKLLLQHERDEANLKEFLLKAKGEQGRENVDEMLNARLQAQDKHDACIETKLQVAQLVKQLGLRRRDILAELTHIFPIATCDNESNNHSANKTAMSEHLYSICAVKVPAAESFNQREDLTTSIGLCYVAQLLTMMSQFLLVPLRYPIVLKGSLSSVVDHVTDRLNDRERIFPIHVKGNKDRFLFEYGVFLLNKNVAQMRYYCGLGTTNLRPTLENIKSLLEERLGTKSSKIGHQSQPIAIAVEPGSAKSSHGMRSTDLASRGSVADLPTPSSGHAKAPVVSAHLRDVEKRVRVPSPQRAAQRIEDRHQGLKSLRGQLFGSDNRQTAAIRRSPAEHRRNNVPRPGIEPANVVTPSSCSPARSSPIHQDFDSVESISSVSLSNRALTGLEELGLASASKDTKLAHSSARAALLGNRATQQSRERTSHWSRGVAGTTAGTYLKQRSELFRKRETDPDPDRSTESNNYDTDDSLRKSSNSSSNSTMDVATDLSGSLKTDDRTPDAPLPNSDRFLLSDKLPVEPKTLAPPDIRFLGPNRHVTVDLQSDGELDLC